MAFARSKVIGCVLDFAIIDLAVHPYNYGVLSALALPVIFLLSSLSQNGAVETSATLREAHRRLRTAEDEARWGECGQIARSVRDQIGRSGDPAIDYDLARWAGMEAASRKEGESAAVFYRLAAVQARSLKDPKRLIWTAVRMLQMSIEQGRKLVADDRALVVEAAENTIQIGELTGTASSLDNLLTTLSAYNTNSYQVQGSNVDWLIKPYEVALKGLKTRSEPIPEAFGEHWGAACFFLWRSRNDTAALEMLRIARPYALMCRDYSTKSSVAFPQAALDPSGFLKDYQRWFAGGKEIANAEERKSYLASVKCARALAYLTLGDTESLNKFVPELLGDGEVGKLFLSLRNGGFPAATAFKDPVAAGMTHLNVDVRAGRWGGVEAQATKLLELVSPADRVYLLVADILLESRLRQRKPVGDGEIDSMCGQMLTLMANADVRNLPVGLQQESIANPLFRYGVTLAERGEKRKGFATVEAARGWGVALGLNDAETRTSITQRPDVQVIESWVKSQDRPTAILHFVAMPDRQPSVFVVDRNGIGFFQYNVDFATLQRSCARWMKTILAGNPKTPRAGARLASEKKEAEALGNMLIAPLTKRGLLTGIEQLVIVPDGPLHTVPFAALGLEDGARVIDRYVLANVPAARLLPEIRAKRPATPPAFVGLGVPDPQSEDAGVLRSLEVVADALTKRWKGRKLFGQAWPKERLLRESERYSVVNFLTHGRTSSTDPFEASLELPNGRGGRTTVTAREISNRRARREFVGLWACESGIGKQAGGEGAMSLAWAFMMSGTSSVVATKWPINGTSLASVLPSFWREAYRPGVSRSEALRTTMNKLRANPRYSHPYYWAGFDLYGDFRPLVAKDSAPRITAKDAVSESPSSELTVHR